jgi:hypothetical protein
MEDQTQTEDIADWIIFSFHVFNINDFWSNIPWSSASYEQILRSFSKLSQTEVCNDALPACL